MESIGLLLLLLLRCCGCCESGLDRKAEPQRRAVLNPLVKQVLGDAGVDEDLEVLACFGEDVLCVAVGLRVLLLLLHVLRKRGRGLPVEVVIVRGVHCDLVHLDI